MDENPFAPPKATLLGAETDDSGELILEGRKLPPRRGFAWTPASWQIFKLSPGRWILVFVVYMVVLLALAIIPGASLLASILMPVVTAGIMVGIRDLEAGEPLRVATLIAAFKLNVGNLIIAGLLEMAMSIAVSIVAMIPMFAMIAFMGPGMMQGVDPNDVGTVLLAMAPIFIISVGLALMLSLPLLMAIWFTPALIVFHDLGPWVAIKASFRGCWRNIWPLTLFSLVAFFWVIVALIPLGLGLLVIGPLVWISMYVSYRDVFLRTPSTPG